ncbi:unnamed protein product [Brassicogethes aeneus]|uniref:Uncharacterized protein n=1 Tax=Brassicogethes aeneus TaxID=1431903 RepID=A0A9P0BG38_BRAAE|nr:unnamed protein product [Brassicogethes aeneus]
MDEKNYDDLEKMDLKSTQAQLSTEISNKLRAACKILDEKCSDDEKSIWLGYIRKNIRSFNKLIKKHKNSVDKILNKLSEFAEEESGWGINKILNLEININKHELGNGSSYIKLPEEIARKHACVNVKNVDNNCFAWALISALHRIMPWKKKYLSEAELEYCLKHLSESEDELDSEVQQDEEEMKTDDLIVDLPLFDEEATIINKVSKPGGSKDSLQEAKDKLISKFNGWMEKINSFQQIDAVKDIQRYPISPTLAAISQNPQQFSSKSTFQHNKHIDAQKRLYSTHRKKCSKKLKFERPNEAESVSIAASLMLEENRIE